MKHSAVEWAWRGWWGAAPVAFLASMARGGIVEKLGWTLVVMAVLRPLLVLAPKRDQQAVDGSRRIARLHRMGWGDYLPGRLWEVPTVLTIVVAALGLASWSVNHAGEGISPVLVAALPMLVALNGLVSVALARGLMVKPQPASSVSELAAQDALRREQFLRISQSQSLLSLTALAAILLQLGEWAGWLGLLVLLFIPAAVRGLQAAAGSTPFCERVSRGVASVR